VRIILASGGIFPLEVVLKKSKVRLFSGDMSPGGREKKINSLS